eukprot:scaffold7362_cov32-Phaeocystis_antarctica.AAC.1
MWAKGTMYQVDNRGVAGFGNKANSPAGLFPQRLRSAHRRDLSALNLPPPYVGQNSAQAKRLWRNGRLVEMSLSLSL